MPRFYFFFQCPDGNACLKTIYLHIEVKKEEYEFAFNASPNEVHRFLAGLTDELEIDENVKLDNICKFKGKVAISLKRGNNIKKLFIYRSMMTKILERFCMIRLYGVLDVEGIRSDVRIVTAGYA